MNKRLRRTGELVGLALALSGCQAWFWTPEQRASHEAYEKGFAACDKLTDFMERKRCMDDLSEDLTQVDPDELVGVGLTGIDHLADHLSVQEFSVNGISGAQAGQGGRHVCCADLPRVWRSGLSVEVRWNVTNWRDCAGQDFARNVPVEPYDQLGQMWVHFLGDGSVRVVSSNWSPRAERHPIRDPIPNKQPWKDYSLDETCKAKQEQMGKR